MEIIRRVPSMRQTSQQSRKKRLRIGFVPTMGALHRGHLSLIRAANEIADVVVVSIFVNPTQFGPEEDLELYPRTLTEDTDLCIQEGVDYLFTPEPDEIYPPGSCTFVEVPGLSEKFEGESRPGHFRGVATVVLKLLQIVDPDIVFLGQKDAQQAVVVRRLIADLLLDVELSVQPTVREDDGLALSSRNRYLTADQRRAAVALPNALDAARRLAGDEPGDASAILAAARSVLDAESGLRVDYLEIVDAETLLPVSSIEAPALLLAAVFCGETRLLDNVALEPLAGGRSRAG